MMDKKLGMLGLLCWAILLGALIGCGQKGPLVIPPSPTDAQQFIL